MSGFTAKQQFVYDVVTQFQRLCPDCPSGKFSVWEDTLDDPPDVMFDADSIGIEVTRYLRGSISSGGSELRATEVMQDRVIEEARQIYEGVVGQPAIWVSAHWNHTYRPKHSDINQIAQDIVDAIRQGLSQNSDDEFSLDWHDYQNTSLANNVYELVVRRLPSSSKASHWTRPSAGYIDDSCQTIQEITEGKDKDLSEMRSKAENLWLLIVATEEDISSMVAFPIDCCVNTSFDRVFFMWSSFTPRVTEMKCAESDE